MSTRPKPSHNYTFSTGNPTNLTSRTNGCFENPSAQQNYTRQNSAHKLYLPRTTQQLLSCALHVCAFFSAPEKPPHVRVYIYKVGRYPTTTTISRAAPARNARVAIGRGGGCVPEPRLRARRFLLSRCERGAVVYNSRLRPRIRVGYFRRRFSVCIDIYSDSER